MRLFVAVELSEDVKQELVALKADIPGATWVKPAAMHLTLRFLGDDIDPVRLTPLITALAAVKAAPFTLALRGTGRFPPGSRRPARVLWVGIAEQPALAALHKAIEQAVAAVGFPPEDRDFSPHITLARLKSDGASPQVARFLEKHGAFRAAPFTAAEFHLFSSRLTPQGPHYRHEASFPLTG